MSRTKYASFLVTITLYLLLVAGCAQPGSSVNVGGHPVTDAAFVTAVQVVHGVEVGTVAIGEYLIQRHAVSCRGLSEDAKLAVLTCVNATGALKLYAREHAPKILLALQGVRKELTIVATLPNGTTQEKVQEALAVLAVAFQSASAWATERGYVAPVGP